MPVRYGQPQPSAFVYWYHNPPKGKYYYLQSKIGEGGFGEVWRGVTSDNVSIAVKVHKPTNEIRKDFRVWRNESDLYLKSLTHPHIVTAYDQFQTAQGHLVIVLELADGTLEDLMLRGRRFSVESTCAVGLHLLSALKYLHRRLRTIHRDVTPKNVLWFSGGICKLADFGIAKQNVSSRGFAKTHIGSPTYIPPELIFPGESTRKSDIYQLGMTLLALLLGRDPLSVHDGRAPLQVRILQGWAQHSARELSQEIGPSGLILAAMLNVVPSKRPTIQKLNRLLTHCRYAGSNN